MKFDDKKYDLVLAEHGFVPNAIYAGAYNWPAFPSGFGTYVSIEKRLSNKRERMVTFGIVVNDDEGAAAVIIANWGIARGVVLANCRVPDAYLPGETDKAIQDFREVIHPWLRRYSTYESIHRYLVMLSEDGVPYEQSVESLGLSGYARHDVNAAWAGSAKGTINSQKRIAMFNARCGNFSEARKWYRKLIDREIASGKSQAVLDKSENYQQLLQCLREVDEKIQ